tara:strand:+ start:698 stop:1426 length:729 start_codon:yes stop_codon:yes gene_type:complete
MKKNLFLNLSLKFKYFYKIYLLYNIYIRNLKYLLKDSYSQFGEDAYLKKYFKKRNGFYVDIGCHHPFRYNNTFILYKRGWTGLNIDLSQISIDLFNLLRPKDINICTAISNKTGKIKFYIPNKNPLSPEITTDQNFTKKFKKLHGNSYDAYTTKSTTWKAIEKKYKNKIKKIDLLKIDIEGSDLKVLKSINLFKLKPTLIMTEAPSFEKLLKRKIISFLKTKNYSIIFDNNLNIIFKRKDGH